VHDSLTCDKFWIQEGNFIHMEEFPSVHIRCWYC